MTRAIPRLEIWDGLACNGGHRLATAGFIREWLSGETTVAEAAEESFVNVLPLTAEAAAIITEGKHVIRQWRSDTDWEEWIVRKVAKTRDHGGRVTATCGPVSYLLAEGSNLVAEWQTTDPAGDPQLEVTAQGTITDLWQTYLIDNPKINAQLPFLALGTIAPSVEISLSWSFATVQAFINASLEQAQTVAGVPYLFRLVRNGSASYDLTVSAVS